MAGSVHWGYFVWCDCDHYYEPEGTVIFDHEPVVGEVVRLCDGRDYTLKRVSRETMEAWAVCNAPNVAISDSPTETSTEGEK